MNEARLINWALNGEFKGLDRDSLSYEDLDLLASLEVQDLILIASKCTYEERIPNRLRTSLLKASRMQAWRLKHE
ncbi:hypothetical protein [Acinetobacter nectaris]|uniref:hypothetical protein n=1 Tax=Acinetobacter nectaris TaxID=1219382 RepID=UPI001F1F9426|nr:hypothetical protein [Acinetobacter nectaris]MCF9046325.1 hypothetical protein [Acinetobacter nectaris]